MAERKGLRFEVRQVGPEGAESWVWHLVGKGDEVYASSFSNFDDEAECRSHIAKVRKVFKGAGFAKVVTVS